MGRETRCGAPPSEFDFFRRGKPFEAPFLRLGKSGTEGKPFGTRQGKQGKPAAAGKQARIGFGVHGRE